MHFYSPPAMFHSPPPRMAFRSGGGAPLQQSAESYAVIAFPSDSCDISFSRLIHNMRPLCLQSGRHATATVCRALNFSIHRRRHRD